MDSFQGSTFTAFATGVNSPYLNPVIQRTSLDVSDIKDALQEIHSFYDRYGLPWTWTFQSDFCTEHFIESLKDAGFDHLDDSVAMALSPELKDFNFSAPDFVVKEISSYWEDWCLVLQEAFENEEGTIKQYLEAHQRQREKSEPFYHFVGYYQSIPVVSATFSKSNFGIRFDDIGTRPAYQRRGFASALLAHILKKIKSLKMNLEGNYCFLESSEDGLDLYKKIGFKPIFSNKTFGLGDFIL